MTSPLSVSAKEFVPDKEKQAHESLRSSLSVDVADFVPKKEATKQPTVLSQKKSVSKAVSHKGSNGRNVQKDSKEEFSPRHDLNWANEKVSKKLLKENFNPRHDRDWAKDTEECGIEDFSPRHDRSWFHRETTEASEEGKKRNHKMDLRKSDSYHVSLTQQRSVSLRTKAERKKLVQTFSLGYAKYEKRLLQSKKSTKDDGGYFKAKENMVQPTVSWSTIVKTPAPKEQLSAKKSMGLQVTDQRNTKRMEQIPNTGHSRDLRTKSYDIERDKRAKMNKLKKTTSVLDTLEQAPTQYNTLSPKTIHKRLSHQTLTESKSLGSYDFMLGGKPKLNIKRKSLVLKAKLSAGIKHDPKMDNWFNKEIPAKIEMFSTLTKDESSDSDDKGEPIIQSETDNHVKRKLTRTTKKVFSPLANVTDFTNKIISSKSLNDDYFTNEMYKSDSIVQKEVSKGGEPQKRKMSLSDVIIKGTDSVSIKDMTNNSEYSNLTPAPISYSAMLKKAAPVFQFNPKVDEDEDDELPEPVRKMMTSEEIRLFKKAKKKEKKKIKKQRKIEENKKTQVNLPMKATKDATQQSKPSQKGLSLDISEMFDKLLVATPKSKQGKKLKQKRIVISTGVVSVMSGLAKKNTSDGKKTARNKYGGTGVIMDGATPIVKRGKERQTPKKKKPTLLKRIIKAERERKHLLLEKAKAENDFEKQKENTEGIKEETQPIPQNESSTNESEAVEENVESTADVVTEIREKVNKTSLSDLPEGVCKQLHSRKFREYCDHVLMKEINSLTHELLITLQKFQDRVYHENPMKFKQKRRFVLGLREVLKHMKLKKIKAVIIAPNLERISSEGGLDDYLRTIISLCEELEIPKIFAMNRHGLGKTLKKKAPVSVVGIFNYDGSQDIFKDLLSYVEEAKKTYQEKIQNVLNQTQQQQGGGEQCLHKEPLVIENIKQHPSSSVHYNINSDVEQLKQRILSNFTREEFGIVDDDNLDQVHNLPWDLDVI